MKWKNIFQNIKAPIKVAVLGCAVNGPEKLVKLISALPEQEVKVLLFRKGEIVRKFRKQLWLKN